MIFGSGDITGVFVLLIVGREGSEKEASVSISSSISSSKVSGSAAMSRHDKSDLSD